MQKLKHILTRLSHHALLEIYTFRVDAKKTFRRRPFKIQSVYPTERTQFTNRITPLFYLFFALPQSLQSLEQINSARRAPRTLAMRHSSHSSTGSTLRNRLAEDDNRTVKQVIMQPKWLIRGELCSVWNTLKTFHPLILSGSSIKMHPISLAQAVPPRTSRAVKAY